MNIGSFTPVQGFFNSNGDLINQMKSLAEQRRAASDRSNFTNESIQSFLNGINNSGTSGASRTAFANLERVSSASAELRSQVSNMASLGQLSSSVGREAVSSNNAVLSATVSSGALVSNFTRTDVNVTQTAQGQQNRGDALAANENSFGDSFGLSITDSSGRTSTFNVNLASNADNTTAMRAMAEQINSSTSNTGVRATLIENSETGTVSLQMSSIRTGETDGRFTVSDTSAANLGNVTSQATNAQFSVNGTNFTSQTNEVTLQSGVTATLNQTGSTQITYQADTRGAVNSVQGFVNAFNNLRDAASGSPELTRQLNEVARNFNRTLGFSGLGVNADGRMEIRDSGRLSQAISDGSFARSFQGVGNIGDRLSNVAQGAFRTAYDSAVQQNFRNFMSASTQSTSNNFMQDWFMPASAGLFFNMRV